MSGDIRGIEERCESRVREIEAECGRLRAENDLLRGMKG